MSENAIAGCLDLPSSRPKPRRLGMNLCLDDGIGARQTADLLSVVGDFVDVIRIGRAGAALFRGDWLREKAAVCAKYGVTLEIGGPLYEVAYLQGRTIAYFDAVLEMGLSALEISVNVIEPSEKELFGDIAAAAEKGLHVFFEYGRKYPEHERLDIDDAVGTSQRALEAGAAFVQIERSEIELVIDDQTDGLLELADRVGRENLTFEVGPRRPELAEKLLRLFGNDANLASLVLDPPNAVDGVFIVENARRGMERFVGYEFIAKGARLPFDLAPTAAPLD